MMKYGLYLYKTTAAAGNALCIDRINRALSGNNADDWKMNEPDRGMLHFDAESIRREITDRLTTADGQLCRAAVRHTPQNKVEYLYVVTAYEQAEAVLNVVQSIAVEHELVLYDAEMDRSFYTTDLYHKYLKMRLRARELNDLIFRTQKPLRGPRRLDIGNRKRTESCSYVVTFIKDGTSLEDRVLKFCEFLKSHLTSDEELSTGCRCFTVYGDRYEICYCLEGYNKNADKIGYVDDGQIKADLMRRMPCEVAARQLGNLEREEVRDVYSRMQFREWVNRYPNPAERFVASVNLAKQLRKRKV